MTKKIYGTDFPTLLNFIFLAITCGAFGFYFLYREAKKNQFFSNNKKLYEILLIVGGIVYSFSFVVFNGINILGFNVDNSMLPNLFIILASITYSIIYIFGYFYLIYISTCHSDELYEKRFSFIELIFFICFGILFVSTRQNYIAQKQLSQTP